jgi:hypothetical protein
VETVDCHTCVGKVSLKVFRCAHYGEAVLGRPIKGVRGHCDGCKKFELAVAGDGSSPASMSAKTVADTFCRISPIGTGRKIEGSGRVKPWQYRTTAIIPHLNTPDYLSVVVQLLQLQTEPPYIIVVDTGSPFPVCEQIERMRSDDVEIHFIRANGYGHTSEPVCVALDLGFARASTPLIFLTHSDCFPTKRNALQWLGDQCSEACPVVGWEMSDRSFLTDDWPGMVSHTFTVVHAPTMRRIGATWHMARAREQLGLDAGSGESAWPDTETGFAYCLRAHGVAVKLLGSEVNYERQVTDWWDHARSLTGTQLYCPEAHQGVKTAAYAAEALADGRRRIAAWKSNERVLSAAPRS